MMKRTDFGKRVFQEFNSTIGLRLERVKCSICILLWTKRETPLFAPSSTGIWRNVWRWRGTDLTK